MTSNSKDKIRGSSPFGWKNFLKFPMYEISKRGGCFSLYEKHSKSCFNIIIL